ncbi:hypothetical protein Fmac_022867 [Flemingia macrophylla]|uniref:Uncharacterized protein n=1 Tax=Flemingia macrophylla TaxID=520843 RepID=A0ABD1LJV8_9FABA
MSCCHFMATTSANVIAAQYEIETKRVESGESILRTTDKASKNIVRDQPICSRVTGTVMTPSATRESSRAGTLIRATTPATKSSVHSGTSTPVTGQNGLQVSESGLGHTWQCGEGSTSPCKRVDHQAINFSPLEIMFQIYGNFLKLFNLHSAIALLTKSQN